MQEEEKDTLIPKSEINPIVAAEPVDEHDVQSVKDEKQQKVLNALSESLKTEGTPVDVTTEAEKPVENATEDKNVTSLQQRINLQRNERAEALKNEFYDLYKLYGDNLTIDQAAAMSSVSPEALYAYAKQTDGIKNGGATQYAWDATMRDDVFNSLLAGARARQAEEQKAANDAATSNPTALATLINGNQFTTADKVAIANAVKNQDDAALSEVFARALGVDNIDIEGKSLYTALQEQLMPEAIPADATPEQKAEIAARNAEKAKQLQILSQVMENSDLDYDEATGRWSVTDRSLAAQLKEREKKKQELELQARLKAEEAKRNRVGIASLAASLGDMFRAGLGGPVTPRDLSAMYNQMDARQQKAYDTYLARQQYERELENQRELLAQQQAQKLASERAQREWEATKMDRQNQFTLGLHREDNAAAQKRAETQAQGRITAAGLSGKNATTKTQKYSTSVTIGGVSYGVPYESGAKTGHMEDALGAIKNYITDYVSNHATAPTGFTDNTSEVTEASRIKGILDRIWSENYKERSNSATGDEIELTEQSLSAITGAISRSSLPQSVKSDIVGLLESVGYKKMDGSASTQQEQQAASGYGDDDEEGGDGGSEMFD